jgi:uncharacterized protein (UPF0335 family)
MAELRRNGYSDEDLAQLVERREAAQQAAKDEKDAAAAKLKRQLKMIDAEAKSVGVAIKPFHKICRVRKLEKELAAEVETVGATDIELFADMHGQMSFLKPEKPGDTATDVAIRRAREQSAEDKAKEQAEGAAALNELAGGGVH